jgi:hypothetical protein
LIFKISPDDTKDAFVSPLTKNWEIAVMNGVISIKRVLLIAATFIAIGAWGHASANVVVLNFAGLNGDAEEEPLNYYDGGQGSLGSGPGTNYGITFPSNVITCAGADTGGPCNTAEVPGGPGANLIFFLSGTADTMDVTGGFTTGFSFYYSAANDPGSVSVWSGLDGTGTLLATLNLPLTPNDGNSGCDGTNFCPYVPIGVSFSGTAESVNFGGSENQVGFADITFGSVTAGGPIPEPASMAILGVGLGGLGAIRRRKRVQ